MLVVRRAELFRVFAAYLGAALAAGACWLVLDGESPLALAAYADLAATVVVFGFSVAYNNSSVYDPYWSAAPPVLGAYWALAAPPEVSRPRLAVVLVLVTFWGARLTWNWLRGWGGLGHEDWRYQDIRVWSGRGYWWVSLLGIHLFPTVQVFLGCLPLYALLMQGERELGWVDGVALLVTAGGVLLETVADSQLRAHKERGGSGTILRSGVWAYSRHPNYLGELLFWWGLSLFAVAAGAGAWWTLVGAVSITVMFVFISIPLLERRSLARRPGYAEHRRAVPVLIPWQL